MAEVRHRNALPEGHELYWYRIEAVLGQGGFGITYRAYDTNLERVVAIKEYLPSGVAVRDVDLALHPVSAEAEEHFHWGFDRFVGEARVLARFNHPNIVRVLNVFEANNSAYIVMEYEQGQSLLDIRDELQGAIAAALEGADGDPRSAVQAAVHDTLEAHGFDPQEVQRSMRDAVGEALAGGGGGLQQLASLAGGGAEGAEPAQLVERFLQSLRAGSHLDLEF